jgi:signal transduction histidine kinase
VVFAVETVCLLAAERLALWGVALAFGAAAIGYLVDIRAAGFDAVWLYLTLAGTGALDVLAAGRHKQSAAEAVRRAAPVAGLTIFGSALLPLIGPRDRTVTWNHPATATNVAIDTLIALAVWAVAFAIQFGTEAIEKRVAREQSAVLEERARLARELHDVVAHDLSVVVIQSQAAQLALPSDPDRAGADLRSIEVAARDALAELRRLIGVLRDQSAGDALAPQPGLGDLAELIRQMNDAGLAVDLDARGDVGSVPAGASLSAYRIVQEALTNTRKHAGPVTAHVRVVRDADALKIEVVDNGPLAPAPDLGSGGHGVVGMRERVAMFGGDVEAGPQPGGGWRVDARIPLNGGQ